MKFGVFVGPIYPGEMDPAEAFKLALATTRTAHESGFDGIFAHHYSTGPSHTMFHPLLLLSRLSAECPEGYLGTRSTCFRTPIPSSPRRRQRFST
jgi:hypothetical protein